MIALKNSNILVTRICQGGGLVGSMLVGVVEMEVMKFETWLLYAVRTMSNRRRWRQIDVMINHRFIRV